jgi:hypothetical protein
MATTHFFLYKITVEPKEDSVHKTFSEILENPPVRQVTMAKKGNPFQLEGKIKKVNNLYYGTFCLIQKNELPTKAQFGKEPENIIDDEDEAGLGHYTSFMYDSTNGVIAIQSNRNGASANGLAAYFRRNYKVRDITLEIIINPDELEKLEKMSTISSFQVSIAKPENGTFAASGSKRSFSEINEIADKTNASILTLQVGIGYQKSSSLKRNSIISYVRSLLSRNQTLDVRKIEVKGRESDDDYIETLDLITNKVSIPITYTPPRTITPRFLSDILRKVIDNYSALKPKIDRVYKVKRNAN